MTQSRRAIGISLIYSVPLLLWFSAQLQLSDWGLSEPRLFFRQVLIVLILLQVFAITLLFTNRMQQRWQDDLLAILLVLLYPLPFLAVVWLTGSASLPALSRGLVIVCTVGAVALLIQFCARMLPSRWQALKTGLCLTHILPAVVVWNFRDLWYGLLD